MSVASNNLQIFGTSGTRNSGGIVNIPGPVIVTNIIAIALSGSVTTASGVRLSVNTGTSGAFSGTTTTLLYFTDFGGQSGVQNAGNVFLPQPAYAIDHLALSGVVTVNSGTHIYDLIVTYKSPA